MIMYRPFQSWAAGGEWALTLPAAGSAACVAVGRNCCAVATSDRLLRMFTLNGRMWSLLCHLQLAMLII